MFMKRATNSNVTEFRMTFLSLSLLLMSYGAFITTRRSGFPTWKFPTSDIIAFTLQELGRKKTWIPEGSLAYCGS